jgi:hypothetical protein
MVKSILNKTALNKKIHDMNVLLLLTVFPKTYEHGIWRLEYFNCVYHDRTFIFEMQTSKKVC